MQAGLSQFAANYTVYLNTITTNIANGQAAITAAIADGQTAINATVSGFVDASTTSVLIGLGAKTLTVGTNKGFRAGMMVLAYVTADPTKWMTGTVTSYTAASGVLVMAVTGSNGAGTYAAWTVALSGVQGTQGVQGLQGLTGNTGPTGSGSTVTAQLNGAVVTAAPRPTLNATASVLAADDAANSRVNFSLAGDVASPGASRLYGTDGSGVRGWQAMPSDYTLPTASTSLLGGVKVDGTSITISSGVVSAPASVPRLPRSARSSNVILGVGDLGGFIDASGTWTQTFTAAATLGSGWHCYLRNGGTGDITLDPNGSELIDGLTSYVMYPGETRLVQCDGTKFTSIIMSPFYKVFTASLAGGFVKPPGYMMFSGIAYGAGCSGGWGSGWAYGGGGGAAVSFTISASSFSATTNVVIGAGAIGTAVSGYGSAGSASTLGSLVTAYSGTGIKGGGTLDGVGGPYVSAGAQSGGTFGGGDTSFPNSVYGGAGPGGFSLFGGGGGGGNGGSGGLGVYSGGNGGASSAASSGGDGTPPGGGGGSSQSGPKAGNGARGEIRIWGVV
jgi:hypothetical protein